MAIVDARGDPPPVAAIDAAVAILRAGGIVGVPTDTVYGLAADPFRAGATDRLFKAKRRPRTFELPVLVADVAQALDLATTVPAVAKRLMARFWPGALTVVLPRRPDLNADLGSDDATIGLRCPDHPVPIALCRAVGPIATTSANRHGEDPASTAAEVAEQMGSSVELVLDAGTCAGSPSTVVDCTGEEPRLLREGRLPWSLIQSVSASESQ
ncbi:MAG TPA: L-threonylcarbamoyladenylate synthase [Acidimicrobiales bacterium]|nr:L-threonylcarbamoyladenylate synthase [Acidimicrobiales bacterium]